MYSLNSMAHFSILPDRSGFMKNTSERLVGKHDYWMDLEIGTELLSGASQG